MEQQTDWRLPFFRRKTTRIEVVEAFFPPKPNPLFPPSEKVNCVKKIAINISIPQKLLTKIQENIEGKNRSEKVEKCCEAGYEKIVNGE